MNKYQKTFNRNKTLYPNVFSVIKALPDKWVYGDKHTPKLRHPGAILNRATEEIIGSFIKVYKALSDLKIAVSVTDKQSAVSTLMQETATLFGHFDSFQDECYLILKSLSPVPSPDLAPGEKTVNAWLKRNGYECSSDFLSRTHNIQQLIDCFTNRLKHANQKLEFVSVQAGKISIDGFFIEELKADELCNFYQPLPKKGKTTVLGISFNSMLRILWLSFYELCDAIEKVIKKHIKTLHGEDFTKRDIVKHDQRFLEVTELMVNSKEFFYPYEYRKYAKISIQGDILSISYPHHCNIPYPGPLQVQSMHGADGYTKTFTLPFFG